MVFGEAVVTENHDPAALVGVGPSVPLEQALGDLVGHPARIGERCEDGREALVLVHETIAILDPLGVVHTADHDGHLPWCL